MNKETNDVNINKSGESLLRRFHPEWGMTSQFDDMVWKFRLMEKLQGWRFKISFKKAHPAIVASLKSLAYKLLERGVEIRTIEFVVAKLSRITRRLIAEYKVISNITSWDIIRCVDEENKSYRLKLRDLEVLCLYYTSLEADGVSTIANTDILYSRICQMQKELESLPFKGP